MKKLLNSLPIYLLLFFATVWTTSCLKNNSNTFDFNTIQTSISQFNTINFLNTNVNGSSGLANQNCYFMIIKTDSSYTAADSVQLEIGGAALSKNIAVTIAVDTASFNKFNSNNGGQFLLLPSSCYNIPNKTLTVPAGTRDISIPLTFNTKLIDFSKEYILPITITDASGITISGNFGTILYETVPGNQYMGLYKSMGQRGLKGNTYTINELKYLYDLSGITTILGAYPSAGSAPSSFVPNIVVANLADQSIYVAIGEQMNLIVDPTTNKVTVTNDNLYQFGVATYKVFSGPSTFDPVNHILNLNYGVKDPFTGDSSVVSEVMTRVR